MRDKKLMPEVSEQVKYILDEPYRCDFYSFVNDGDLEILFGWDIPLDWVRIWVLRPKQFSHSFSYNLNEKRWSYGEYPKGFAKRTVMLLKEAFQLNE